MLRVVKVGLKVGVKWPSSTTGPSPFDSMGLGAGQVKTKTKSKSKDSLSVLCHSTKSTLPYNIPTKYDTNSHNNNGKIGFAKPA